MCAPIAGVIAMDARDMTVLQLMDVSANTEADDGCETTSAGFRCALEPGHPSHHLAPLVLPIGLRSAAAELSRAISCARRTRSRSLLWTLSASRCKELSVARREQHAVAQGGALRVSRFVCPMPVLPRGWDRRGGSRKCEHASRTSVCYALPK